jgi:hypothetical protein
MVVKVSRTDWQPENGIAILSGTDDSTRKICEVAVPLQAFSTLNAHARRYIAGLRAKANQQLSHGPMHYSEHVTATTYSVGILPTTEGEKISLILDQGLDTEIGFSIEPEHAHELGQQLVDTVASNTPPARN